jgi:Fic family protein
VRELADKSRLKISLDVVKKIYAHLAPEELEGKGGPRYRKDMPIHRLYFHDISPPDKISYRMRQLMQWLNAADTKRSTHAVRLAAKAHYQLLHIYPFPKHSGKVARLVMNLILLRNGYPPAVIHATERQRYYEALKSSENAASAIVHEALVASVESAIRFFEGDAGSSGEIRTA